MQTRYSLPLLGRLARVAVLFTGLLLPWVAQAQTPAVTVTPAGPLTLCAGSTQTLTATATVPGFNVAGSGFLSNVRAVVVQADGKVLVGGQFASYNGNAAPNRVLRLNADGSLDNTFNPSGTGADGAVAALAVQADGKVLVGGFFTSYNGNAAAPDVLLRLNADGTLDTTFNSSGTGISSTTSVTALVVQADGKILVGGTFTDYNGNAAAPDRVLRLNADGTLDTTFNNGGVGIGSNSEVRALAVQADGKVLVGGFFSVYNGNAAAPDRVLRLNADGSLDTTFNNGGTGTETGSTVQVETLVVQADGKILVGGQFTTYNGDAAAPNNLLRLNANGTLDATYNNGGAGASSGVYEVTVQADGKVLVGGTFTDYNGNAAPDRVLRLNADGTLDTTFNTGGAGASGGFNIVQVLAIQADGKVLIGGSFTTYNGNAAAPDNLLRLNADGSLNNGVPTGLAYTWSNGATGPSITVSQPGDYQATATTTSNGTGYSNVVRVNAPAPVAVQVTPAGPLVLPAGGSALLTATATTPGFKVQGSGFNGNVYTVVVQPDGKVLVGGFFTAYNGNAAAPDYVLRLNADGSLDNTFNPGGAGADDFVYMLALQADGKVLVAGQFTGYNGNDAAPDDVLRLNTDGSLDMSFNTGGAGASYVVYALAVQPNGKVLVGGLFTSYNGSAAAPDRLLRLNADGSIDTGFNAAGVGLTGTATNNYADALAVQADGKVLVGGRFTSYNANAAAPDNLLRINADGSLDTGFNAGGTGANSLVLALVVQPDGKVLAGGYSTAYNGNAVGSSLLRVNVDGSFDTGFNTGGSGANGEVYGLAVQADGKVLVGGAFTAYNGNAAAPDRLLRLNANGSLNDAATPLPGATFVFNPGNTSGNTRTVTMAGTYTATATDPASGCTYTSNAVVVTMVAPADLIISTTQTVPAGIYRNITVTSTGVGTLGGAVAADSVRVQAGGILYTACQVVSGSVQSGGRDSFVLEAGGTLGICDAAGIAFSGATGAIQTTSRRFSQDATYIYNGTGAQVTGTGLPGIVRTVEINATSPVQLSQALNLRRELRLTSGVLDLNGRFLRLLSDATATAQVNQDGSTTTGSVTGGSATVQRYILANGNPGLGYRHLSSPVSGNRLDDLAVPGGYQPLFNAAYNTSAASASVVPFPNVFGFDPARIGTTPSSYSGLDQGYYSPVTGTVPDLFVPGRGYSTQIAAGQTVDFVGSLNQTTLALPLPRVAGTANPDDGKGWNLLGNPFPSAFALSALDNTPGLDNAKYIFQSTGPYAGSYLVTLGSIGQPLLAPGQGFFARVSTPGTTATVTFALAGRRVDFTTNSTFHRPTAETRPFLALELATASGTLRDQTTLYAEAGATAGLDAAYDAVKLANPHGLNLSQLLPGSPLALALALNALPALTSGTVVPLRVGVPAAGPYVLRVNQLLNLPAGTSAVLVDNELNTRTDLATLPAAGYAFSVSAAQAATALTGRFWLNLVPAGTALATASGQANALVQLFPNPARATATLTGTAPGTRVQVLDALGRAVLATVADATGTAVLRLPAGLASGVYLVRAGTTALRLTVE